MCHMATLSHTVASVACSSCMHACACHMHDPSYSQLAANMTCGTGHVGTKASGTKASGTKASGTKASDQRPRVADPWAWASGSRPLGTKALGTKASGTMILGAKTPGHEGPHARMMEGHGTCYESITWFFNHRNYSEMPWPTMHGSLSYIRP